MTGEGKADTEKWIEDKGAEYAYAYVNADAIMRAVEGDGYPHSALIDASGTIVWHGHPSNLTEALIEQHLVGALRKPIFEWPKSAAKIAKLVRANDIGGAIKEAEGYAAKGGELGAEILADLKASLDARVAFVGQRFEAGDYLTVVETGEKLLSAVAGTEAAKSLQEQLDFVAKDAGAQKCLDGQRAWRKLVSKGELRKVKDCDKRMDDLKKLAEKYAGTYAASEIEDQVAVARKRKTELMDR